MALKNQVANVYGVGLRSVGAYQVSGRPWVTGSTVETGTDYGIDLSNGNPINGERQIAFPYVTKTILIRNMSSADHLKLHFVSSSSPGGVTGSAQLHYITLNAGQSITFDVKCKEIYLTAYNSTQTYEIVADLTNIPTGSMYALTGSGITG